MRALKTSFMVFLLVLAACQKPGDLVITLTPTEGANLIATTLSASSNGLVIISNDITVNSQTVFDANIGCGNSKSYTITHQNPIGTAYSYNYALNYNYTLNCNSNNAPDNITGGSTDNGTFDGPLVSSTNSGTSTFRVAGLTQTAAAYVINGEYKRIGTFTSKVDSKSTSNLTLDINVTGLSITKSTKLIASGTATVTITGTTTTKGNVNFTANITFTGNNKATVVISGSTYIVDISTGDCTKQP